MSTKKTFEENLQDLEAIVTKLETGDVALEDAIAEFQKGMALSKDLQKIDQLTARLEVFIKQDFERKQKEVALLSHRLQGLNLLTSVENYQDRRESLQRLLVTTTKNTLNGYRVRLEKAQDALLSLDTSRIVARGYAIVNKGDKPLTTIKDITEGDQLTIQMMDVELEVEVKNVN